MIQLDSSAVFLPNKYRTERAKMEDVRLGYFHGDGARAWLQRLSVVQAVKA